MPLHGHYNLWLVALSYVIGSAGSYAALRLARPPDGSASPTSPFAAINSAAIVLGISIWVTHFTGMAAFSLPGMTLGYRLDLTLLSLFVAIVFTWFGFATWTLSRHLPDTYFLGGLPMGCGILAMHFVGMAAMTGEMQQRYEPALVIAAALIAIGASVGALWLTSRPYHVVRSIGAALAMGAAICGMHYVGMAAAVFRATAPAPAAPAQHPRDHRGTAVVYFTCDSAKCDDPVATDGWRSTVRIRNRV